jgi:hypothetical protein
MEEAKQCELKLPVEIQEDHPHPLRRACPDRSYCISQPHQGGEGPYSRLKVGTHPRHEAEGLQEGVTRPKDYVGSDYSDDRRPSSWATAGRDDNDLYI